MNFAFSDEQEELRRQVRRFLEDKAPISEVRRLMETGEGHDPATRAQMGTQLGLQGLAVPEVYEGAGYGWVEQVVVFEEMGRALVPSPYFATVALAGAALATSGDEEAQKELLSPIATGEAPGHLGPHRGLRPVGPGGGGHPRTAQGG